MSRPWVVSEGYQGECRRRNGNGGARLIWWMMVSACGAVFLGYTAWMTNLHARMQELGDDNIRTSTQVVSLESRTVRIEQLLTRIEDKVDRLVERDLPKSK